MHHVGENNPLLQLNFLFIVSLINICSTVEVTPGLQTAKGLRPVPRMSENKRIHVTESTADFVYNLEVKFWWGRLCLKPAANGHYVHTQ